MKKQFERNSCRAKSLKIFKTIGTVAFHGKLNVESRVDNFKKQHFQIEAYSVLSWNKYSIKQETALT